MPGLQNANSRKTDVLKRDILDRPTFEMYQAFMAGYVRRINQASFKVAIGGVRIGHAKYSRLAQINLKSRIITFSRYAIENVPERGRRYLVLHELAHVKEASHNKQFWNYVGEFEPDYRKIGQNLENAFKQNVTASHRERKGSGQQESIQRIHTIAHFALHKSNSETVLIHKPLHPNSTDTSADTTSSAVIAKPCLPEVCTLLHPDLQALNLVDPALNPSIAPESYHDEADIWEEIAEEFTYWRDNSDEDSDVDMSGPEHHDDFGAFDDCDD